MKIVIDIEDAVLDCVRDRYADGEMPDDKSVFDMALYAIANGTVFPKGHGRLLILDEKLVKKYFTPFSFSCQKWISEVGISNAILKVIKADKEVENESD